MKNTDNSLLKSIGEILRRAREENIIHHGAVSVSIEEREVLRVSTHKAADSLYDLASLTKPICGLTLFLVGKAKGLWDEDTRVDDLLPSAGEGVKGISLAELLSHDSGLAAWNDYYRFKNREEILESVANEKRTDKRPLYSDLGYILLTRAFEAATNRRVDDLWADWGAREGWEDIRFVHDMGKFPAEEVIPTENTFHRKGLLLREVNDDNCFRMDSVSLHAGLFGNLTSISNWFWAMSAGRIVPQAIFEQTLKRGNKEFLPGWMKKTGNDSNAGSGFSDRSFGMLGFTGCSFFFDPTRDILAVFLASRVSPTHDSSAIRRLRREVYDRQANAWTLKWP